MPRSLPVDICPATAESHATISVCFYGITHTPSPTGSGFSLVQHTSQNTPHTSKPAIVPADHPSLNWHTYLWYPLIAVQWHNLHVPITCLNLQSHDTISCQTCYLIFWNFLVYLSEVENSKYGTRNTSTTGSTIEMNKDVPLIVNNNHAIGVIMLTLLNYTYFSFSDWSTFWNQTTKTPTGFHTDPHHTKLEGYRHLQLHRLLQNHHIPSIMT